MPFSRRPAVMFLVVLSVPCTVRAAQLTPARLAVLLTQSESKPDSVFGVYSELRLALVLGDYDRALGREMLAQALRLAEGIEEPDRKLRAKMNAARHFAWLGARDEARALYAKIQGFPGVDDEYAAMFHMDVGDFDKSLELIEALAPPPNTRVDDSTYDDIIATTNRLVALAKAHDEAGGRRQALRLLSRAHAFARTPPPKHSAQGVLMAVSRAYAQMGELERAVEAAREIPNTMHPATDAGEQRFSPIRWKVMLHIDLALRYRSAGQTTKAHQLLAQAAILAKGIPHRHLRGEMMKDVALTYAGAGRYSGFSSLSNMAPRDDNPDPFDSARGIALARAMDHPLLKAIAMAWIANRLSEDGKQTEARKLVAEALAMARAIRDDSPDAFIAPLGFFSFSSADAVRDLINSTARAGQVDEAIRLATEAPGRKDNTPYILDSIARICLEQNNKEVAFELIERLESKYGQSPSPVTYARAGEHASALIIARAMGDDDLDALVRAYTKSRQFDLALEAIAAMNKRRMRGPLITIGRKYPSEQRPLTPRARRTLEQIARRFLVTP